MKVRRQETSFSILLPIGLVIGSVISFVVLTNSLLDAKYKNTFYPNVLIDNIDVGGLTKNEAFEILAQQPVDHKEATLQVETLAFDTSTSNLGLHKNIEESMDVAYGHVRTANPFSRIFLVIRGFFQPHQFTSQLIVDESLVRSFVHQANEELDNKGVLPTARVETRGSQKTAIISQGVAGREIDIEETTAQLLRANWSSAVTLPAVTIKTGRVLSDNELQQAQERAQKLINKQLVLRADIDKITLYDAQLVTFLTLPTGINTREVMNTLQTHQSSFERLPQDAAFEFDATTLQVKKFVPHLEGRQIDVEQTAQLVIAALEELEKGSETRQEVELVVETTQPDRTLASTNELGIAERIGFGDSHYAGSIPSRIHNVSNASKILNYSIVKPGELFSFNQRIGEISRRTGYQPAYIISGGQTVLGDGGGVCQVSTTLFRALLNAGLDITRRRQHSYRVGYYEQDQQPGFDAAVFSGEADLRFVNDTDHHLLLVFNANPTTQYMSVEIYGTSDGRTTEIVDYEKWDARPAAATVYFDDPTLPAGKLVQVDWAVGGIKTKFTHITRDKDGNILRQKEYTSNYVPWSAKYRRGTGN